MVREMGVVVVDLGVATSAGAWSISSVLNHSSHSDRDVP